MILNKLGLHDFGVFSGHHSVDLKPREKDGSQCPIILFGGLNGAGKTTTLTAVRLALYGRQSLGRAVSTKDYHAQLIDYIHRPAGQVLSPYSAAVQIDFTYGKRGKNRDYKVIRSWEKQGNDKVAERISIYQDTEELKGLTQEQLQSFLNELIPIGVADLFFFDGEKIAELAEDTNNEALADAIKRLLGLDIVDRLRADLSVYLREHVKSELPEKVSAELTQREEEYRVTMAAADLLDAKRGDLVGELVQAKAKVEAVRGKLMEHGGAWAQSREAEEAKLDQLLKQKSEIANQIKALYGSTFVLSYAPKTLGKVLAQLEAEQKTKYAQAVREGLTSQIDVLKSSLSKGGGIDTSVIDEAVTNAFGAALDDSGDVEVIHDLSNSDFEKVSKTLNDTVPAQVKEMNALKLQRDEIEAEIAAVSENIARAPDQSRIEAVLAELSQCEQEVGRIEAELEANKDEAKRKLRDAMNHLRRLREIKQKYAYARSHQRAVELASNSRRMLVKFAEQTREKKIARLEQEFVKSFSKLARKDDMQISASIDPSNLNVVLTNSHGKTINRKKLSAGEKQIYAIAMLEALGRTSGRNLPIIIDTPLGRLDSKHRTKLVENYFPTASHQVLILSTDTEIDEDFYSSLSPEISHAFSVDYDAQSGQSQFNEGYFWRQKEVAEV